MFITQVVPGVWGVAIATGVMTVLVVVFVEVLPKTLAIVRADDVARALSGTDAAGGAAAGPGDLRDPVDRAAHARASSASGSTWAPTCWPRTRRSAARSNTTTPKARSRAATGAMLGGVLDLGELDVADVMVHRQPDRHARRRPDPPREIVGEALKSPYTRLPLYRGEPENIIGVLHAKDLARAIADGRAAIDAARHRRDLPPSPGSCPRPPT